MNTKYEVAIHEAGHAVVARLLGRNVVHVTAVPDETTGYSGASTRQDADMSGVEEPIVMRSWLEAECITMLAGYAAVERLIDGWEWAEQFAVDEHEDSDARRADAVARQIARTLPGAQLHSDDDGVVWGILCTLASAAAAIVTAHRSAVERMAEELMERDLTEDDVHRIVHGADNEDEDEDEDEIAV